LFIQESKRIQRPVSRRRKCIQITTKYAQHGDRDWERETMVKSRQGGVTRKDILKDGYKDGEERLHIEKYMRRREKGLII